MNGKQKGKLYAERVENWIAQRDKAGDFHEYNNGGKINRAALCAELDFSRSVTTQNLTVRDFLDKAEKRWFGEKEKTDSKAHEAARERSEKRANQRASEVSKLEDEIAKLKAENATLRKQLERFSAIDEVIQQTGMAPRSC
ncbi:DUF6262 family protein [Aliamphritea ceti]|uniref:DUF6262 family protein n=1 Tax=Aliamphritea ceti TaxID=1524258 RepID=UPI0021C3817D|nr:DUF6262 family protein [Aliamphritea ceti]